MLEFTPAPFEDDMDVNNWPKWSADHCDIDKARAQGNQIVNTIIDNAPIVGNKPIVVDVRTQRLDIGFNTLALGWHEDVTEDPDAIHHLYIIGKNRTEFLIDDEPFAIPDNNYVTYTNDVTHRAVEVSVAEFRLFIRIQECDAFVSGWSNVDLLSYYPYIFPETGEVFRITEDEYMRYFDARSV